MGPVTDDVATTSVTGPIFVTSNKTLFLQLMGRVEFHVAGCAIWRCNLRGSDWLPGDTGMGKFLALVRYLCLYLPTMS